MKHLSEAMAENLKCMGISEIKFHVTTELGEKDVIECEIEKINEREDEIRSSGARVRMIEFDGGRAVIG